MTSPVPTVATGNFTNKRLWHHIFETQAALQSPKDMEMLVLVSFEDIANTKAQADRVLQLLQPASVNTLAIRSWQARYHYRGIFP